MVALGELLDEASIDLFATASSREDAITQAGALMLAVDAVEPGYIYAMFERESSVSTYVGEGVAVPHGTLGSKESVKRDALVLLRFTDAVDWNGNGVSVVIGIAARGRGYIGLLSRLASILLNPENAEALRSATTTAEVYAILASEQRP